MKRRKEKVTWGEAVSGLEQQAHQDLRIVGKNEDREEHFKTMFDLSVHQLGAHETTVAAYPL